MVPYTISYETDQGAKRFLSAGQPSEFAAKTMFVRQMLMEKSGPDGSGAGIGLHPMPKGIDFPTFEPGVDAKTRETRLIEVAREVWPKLTVKPLTKDEPFPARLLEEMRQLEEANEQQAQAKRTARNAPAAAPTNVRP